MTKKSPSASKKNAALASVADPTAPLDSAAFLRALAPVQKRLEEDLLSRARGSAGVLHALTTRWEAEKAHERTGDAFEPWQRRFVEQVAAAWVLSIVFVRVLEDRGLLAQRRIAGEGADDSLRAFRALAPSLTERDYLLFVFRELSRFPVGKALFDAAHNPVWLLGPSAEVSQALLALFRGPDVNAPAFRFGSSDTRFLGDLYQDLNANVRERYALLQTPDFVEEYILDHTLEPALARFGLADTTLIDPTCGSGHFLLGAFGRLFAHHQRAEPGANPRALALKALGAIAGVDLNPYAVAIARFRLTLAYLEAAGITRLVDANEALPETVVVADSLLHNMQAKQGELGYLVEDDVEAWMGMPFGLDQPKAALAVLGRRYSAVVGNPPYITVKDAVLREQYRKAYTSAAGKYSLSAPFTERFFELASPRGFVGMINANSFMKREFGKALIEQVLPKLNLTAVINTSGAYIPGHGTPTVILLGTNEPPVQGDVLAVLARRGEPSTPEDASQGRVWLSIVENGRAVGFENDYISVAEIDRSSLAFHPWSLAGGGAGDLKELLESRSEGTLNEYTSSIGFMAITGQDDVYVRPRSAWIRGGAEPDFVRPFGIGEEVRDWVVTPSLSVLFPYQDAKLQPPSEYPGAARLIWPFRRTLQNRPDFGGRKYLEAGRPWYELHQVPLTRLNVPMSIAFAFVATHNHFALDRGEIIFNRTSPVVKLAPQATREDHLYLLAYLNSSTACFWMKQVMTNKGMHNGSESNSNPFSTLYEFAGTQLLALPMPPHNISLRRRLIATALSMHETAVRRVLLVRETIERMVAQGDDVASCVLEAIAECDRMERDMVRSQELIDWIVYRLFSLIDESVLDDASKLIDESSGLGDRFFERLLRQSGTKEWDDWSRMIDIDTADSTRRVEPEHTKALFDRILVASTSIAILERPECKRRWRQPSGKAAKSNATAGSRMREGFILRVEELVEDALSRESVALATASIGSRLLLLEQWFNLHEGRIDGLREGRSPLLWLGSILERNAIPYLACLRLNASGCEKFAIWEKTWELQRRADDGGDVGEIPVPPEYDAKDFRDPRFFSLRGKLDVPKERFISYPGCESDEDGEPVYGWAGWNHLERAQALVALYQDRKTREGWSADRLTPMLAGLLELLPWLLQWYDEPSAEFDGERPGQAYSAFLDGECRELGLTREALRAWRPASKRDARAAAKAVAKPKATDKRNAKKAVVSDDTAEES